MVFFFTSNNSNDSLWVLQPCEVLFNLNVKLSWKCVCVILLIIFSSSPKEYHLRIPHFYLVGFFLLCSTFCVYYLKMMSTQNNLSMARELWLLRNKLSKGEINLFDKHSDQKFPKSGSYNVYIKQNCIKALVWSIEMYIWQGWSIENSSTSDKWEC